MATRREHDREERADRKRGRNEEEDGGDEPSLERLVAFIRDRRGVDFSGYKQTSFRRRLHKRMSEAGVADPEEYVDLLQASPGEFQRLFDTLFLHQAMVPEEFRTRVKVFATDVDEAALRAAREGRGPARICAATLRWFPWRATEHGRRACCSWWTPSGKI